MNTVVIDTLGTRCPMPIIKLADAIDSAAAGTVVEILSDDEAAKVDIPVWCRMKKQEYLGVEPRSQGWSFRIRKRA